MPFKLPAVNYPLLPRERIRKGYYEGHPGFGYIKTLQKHLNVATKKAGGYQAFKSLSVIFSRVSETYHRYIQSLIGAKTDEQQLLLRQTPVKIRSLDHQHQLAIRIIKPEILQKVFPSKTEVDFPRGFIHKGVKYTVFPYAPHFDRAVERLSEGLFHTEPCYKQLFNLIDQRQRHFPILATVPSEGLSLHHFITAQNQNLSNLGQNFSEIFLLTLLTSPQDAHFGKFTLSHGQKQFGLSHQDLFFVPSLLKSSQAKKRSDIPLVRCGLYFLPQMQQPIDASFREKLLKLNPETIVLECLYNLSRDCSSDQDLLQEKVFSNEDLRAKESEIINFSGTRRTLNPRGMSLNFELPRGAAKSVYQRLLAIQELIKNNQSVTHDQILAKLHPEIHQIYQTASKKCNGDPLKSLLEIYRLSFDYLSMKPVNQFPDSTDFEDQQILSHVAHLTAHQANLPSKRHESITSQVEDVIAEIDWRKLDEKTSNHYLSFIKKFSEIRTLILKNSVFLSEKRLTSCLSEFPHITLVALGGSRGITLSQAINILRKKSHLTLKIDLSEQDEINQKHFDAILQLGDRLIIHLSPSMFQLPIQKLYELAPKHKNHLVFVSKTDKGIQRFPLRDYLGKPREFMLQFIRRKCHDFSLFNFTVYLLNKNSQNGLKKAFPDGSTFLHRAAEAKNQTVYDWLIKAGINPNIKDNQGRLAADLLSKESHS